MATLSGAGGRRWQEGYAYAEGRIKAAEKKICQLQARQNTVTIAEVRAALLSELSELRAKVISLQAKVSALRRAGRPDYEGRAATKPALEGLQRHYLELARGDLVKAKRLRKADLHRGRVKFTGKKFASTRSRLRTEQRTGKSSQLMQRLAKEISEKRKRIRCMRSTISGLRRAAAPEYDGKAVAERLKEASHRHYMELAKDVEAEVNRLRTAILLEGRSKLSRTKRK